MSNSLGIVVPVLNNWEGAVKALASVETKIPWTPYIQKQWSEDKPIAEAWNYGIREVFKHHLYCLVINDDILFRPYTIDALIRFSDTHQALVITAQNVRDKVSLEEFSELPQPKFGYAESPDFSCFLITREAVDKIGRFDENFYPCYFEDNDFHYRINLAGYKAVSLFNAPYYHFGSVTSKVTQPHDFFRINREYYVKKWGGLPASERFKVPFGGVK